MISLMTTTNYIISVYIISVSIVCWVQKALTLGSLITHLYNVEWFSVNAILLFTTRFAQIIARSLANKPQKHMNIGFRSRFPLRLIKKIHKIKKLLQLGKCKKTCIMVVVSSLPHTYGANKVAHTVKDKLSLSDAFLWSKISIYRTADFKIDIKDKSHQQFVNK